MMLFSHRACPIINKILVRSLAKTSLKPRPEGKHYRLWKLPGDHVLRRDILARQYTMYWHPGLNVGINSDRTIFALCDGVMVITEEKFEPDWEFSLTRKIYKDLDGKLLDVPNFQRYLHVIPKKTMPEFKLVNLV